MCAHRGVHLTEMDENRNIRAFERFLFKLSIERNIRDAFFFRGSSRAPKAAIGTVERLKQLNEERMQRAQRGQRAQKTKRTICAPTVMAHYKTPKCLKNVLCTHFSTNRRTFKKANSFGKSIPAFFGKGRG